MHPVQLSLPRQSQQLLDRKDFLGSKHLIRFLNVRQHRHGKSAILLNLKHQTERPSEVGIWKLDAWLLALWWLGFGTGYKTSTRFAEGMLKKVAAGE